MEITEVIQLRLNIADPHGYINIISATELPDDPSPQTAYRLGEDNYVDSAGEHIELYLSDSRLWSWIDTYGIGDSECIAYKAIAARLGGTMRVKRLSAGTETTEWQSISELYTYYKKLSDDCSERNRKDVLNISGRFGASAGIEIAGGDV